MGGIGGRVSILVREIVSFRGIESDVDGVAEMVWEKGEERVEREAGCEVGWPCGACWP